MKNIIIALFAFFLTLNSSIAQYPSGKVVVDHLYSKLLENSGGENPTRRVTIYLPPGYEESEQRYPVLYYLHGFTWSDSLAIAVDHFDRLLDKAIATGKIKPVIVVMPDQHTLYRGSFYTNSSLTGNWADFTAHDVVSYIDTNYRTIPNKESRGITGHSMGGHGVIKMGMLFPDVFSSVYMLSPAVLGFYADYGPTGSGYKRGYERVHEIKTREELVSGTDFDANALIAIGRAFSPNSEFIGYDFHQASIDHAIADAKESGFDNISFKVATVKDFPGSDFDLVTFFDCLHDMGDPVGGMFTCEKGIKA